MKLDLDDFSVVLLADGSLPEQTVADLANNARVRKCGAERMRHEEAIRWYGRLIPEQ